MLLSARVFTVEEGTHNYGMKVGKKKSYGDILQLDVEVLVQTHDFKNMYVSMFMCMCILYMYECICIFVGGVYVNIHAYFSWVFLRGLKNKVTLLAMSTPSDQAFLVSNTIPHQNKPGLIKERADSRAGTG